MDLSTSGEVRRAFAIDSNVADELLPDPATLARLRLLSATGRITVSHTHVQVDELAAMPSDRADRRAKLLETLAASGSAQQATAVFVFGVSRLDLALLASDEAAAVYGELAEGGASHVNDAIIATTAAARSEILVTGDRQLRGRAERAGVECWTFDEFRRFLSATAP